MKVELELGIEVAWVGGFRGRCDRVGMKEPPGNAEDGSLVDREGTFV